MDTSYGRPMAHDTSVIKLAAEQLCKRVGLNFADEQAVADMTRALGWGGCTFDLARALADRGWEVDDELLRILGDADFEILEARDAYVRRWVAAREVVPQRDVGDVVRFDYQRSPVDGEIRRIDRQHGTYTIFCESLGHVREGDGTHGIVVPFEVIHSLFRPPETFCLEAA
ncbi:hypothetical protein [Burkholderia sp. MBR-1]|uniref:hypothetical protein n=1 Tax=Burkholderia sp. MBR-1 TaxID=2732364 RepID=UPI0015EE62EC|nr:hypothetical protein [Burkholderia sp. MBR-1]QMI49920.1 hypothetical protein MBR110_31165 [Burkholderia sp. MBR-1]